MIEMLSDSKGVMNTIRHLTLEDAPGYIALDELVEITPKSIRIRKKFLTEGARNKARKEGLI